MRKFKLFWMFRRPDLSEAGPKLKAQGIPRRAQAGEARIPTQVKITAGCPSGEAPCAAWGSELIHHCHLTRDGGLVFAPDNFAVLL